MSVVFLALVTLAFFLAGIGYIALSDQRKK
jgi:hypothetical protein